MKNFWNRVNKTKTCWLWTGGKSAEGYGAVCIGGRKSLLAHRFSWELVNSKIPKGKLICHKCDNPPCVNPKHLFLGDYSTNRLDMLKKGRWPLCGEKHPRGKLKESQVISIRNLIKEGLTSRVIGDMFGVSKTNVLLIAKNKIWRYKFNGT